MTVKEKFIIVNKNVMQRTFLLYKEYVLLFTFLKKKYIY